LTIANGSTADADEVKEILPANRIMMYSDTCPTGWTRVSAFDGKFIKGKSAYGGTGGAATHTHTDTGTTGNSATSNYRIGDDSQTVGNTHNHSFSFTTGNGDNEPAYVEIIFCKKDAHPATLNNGVGKTMLSDDIVAAAPPSEISIFDGAACPTGWTRLASVDNKFIKGAAAYGGTGGDNNHTHAISGTTGSGSASTTMDGSPVADVGNESAHTHTFSGTSEEVNNIPEFIDVLLCQRDDYTS